MRHVHFQHLTETEISQLDLTVGKENVIGLEIPVHDVVLIEFFERLQQLPEDDECFLLPEGFLFLEEGLEGAAIAVLIYEVEVVGCFEGFDEANDVVVFEGGEDVDLVDGQLFQFGIGLKGALGDHFHRVLQFRLLVERPKDLAVYALADGLLQQVVLNQLAHSNI